MASFINYKNSKIHFTSQGNGHAVVLLHGFLENLTIWDDLAKELSTRYRVICIDLLGHGKTDNLGYVHTMDEQAQMVKAVLNHLKLRKVVLIGHSMGGYISMAFTKLFLQNVKGVCLLNSTFLADDPTKRSDRKRAIALVKKNPKAIIELAIPDLFADENKELFKSDMQHILTEALKTSKQGIIAALEGMIIREDLSALFETDNFKKLVFIGKHDIAIKNKPLEERLTSLQNIQVVRLSGGHMGFIENKTEVLENLKSFIIQSFK
ncbi:MAG: alpha/beta fold hydrolase [Flavobacteriales bacterium]|nr:alpha/beta fold hydrolase [Flavobacteriales bacterium]